VLKRDVKLPPTNQPTYHKCSMSKVRQLECCVSVCSRRSVGACERPSTSPVTDSAAGVLGPAPIPSLPATHHRIPRLLSRLVVARGATSRRRPHALAVGGQGRWRTANGHGTSGPQASHAVHGAHACSRGGRTNGELLRSCRA